MPSAYERVRYSLPCAYGVGNLSAYGVPSPNGDYGNGTRFVRAKLPQVNAGAFALRSVRASRYSRKVGLAENYQGQISTIHMYKGSTE
jgi:hypothetical protein